MNFRTQLAAILVLLLCTPLVAHESVPTIIGRITDLSGGVISRAHIILHWDPAGSTVGLSDNIGIKEDLILTSDATGEFKADVPAGFYECFCLRRGLHSGGPKSPHKAKTVNHSL